MAVEGRYVVSCFWAFTRPIFRISPPIIPHWIAKISKMSFEMEKMLVYGKGMGQCWDKHVPFRPFFPLVWVAPQVHSFLRFLYCQYIFFITPGRRATGREGLSHRRGKQRQKVTSYSRKTYMLFSWPFLQGF